MLCGHSKAAVRWPLCELTEAMTEHMEFTQVGEMPAQREELRMKFHLLPRNYWPLLAAGRGRANFL